MTSRFRDGIRVLAILVVLAAGGRAQEGVAAADSGNSPAGGDPQPAASASVIGQPPTPVTTTELPYPKLTGIWAQGPVSPSLSEQFNQKLPAWLRFSGEFRERFTDLGGAGFKPYSTNDYDEQRIRLGMLIQPTNWVRFYVQLQDARVFGINPALPPN